MGGGEPDHVEDCRGEIYSVVDCQVMIDLDGETVSFGWNEALWIAPEGDGQFPE